MSKVIEGSGVVSGDIDLLVKQAKSELEKTSLSLGDLLKVLKPEDQIEKVAATEPPLPTAITANEEAALEKVTKVFGSVIPTERRKLDVGEISQLIEERDTLQTLKKMAEDRISEGIRTTIFNHLDIVAEENGEADENTPRSKDGHYILPGEARGNPDDETKFKREVRQSSPALDAAALKSLADDPEFEGFTHEDYLSMTTQVRQVDENKVMIALKKNPKLIHAIAEATRPGSKTAALYQRKA